jgi:hypothetical protein
MTVKKKSKFQMIYMSCFKSGDCVKKTETKNCDKKFLEVNFLREIL